MKDKKYYTKVFEEEEETISYISRILQKDFILFQMFLMFYVL